MPTCAIRNSQNCAINLFPKMFRTDATEKCALPYERFYAFIDFTLRFILYKLWNIHKD